MMVYLTTPEDNELLTDLSWRDEVRKLLNDEQMEKFGNDLADELLHFQETNIPRCPKCHSDFIRAGEHEWMPTCMCAPRLRLMIG